MECKVCGVWFVSGETDGVCLSCKTSLKKMGLDLPYDRIRELVDADKDGRCVVFQVKVGDSVWFTTYGGTPIHFTVTNISLETNSTGKHFYFQVIDGFGNADYFHGEAINKTVFLTREAAEAALKGESK